MAKKRLKWLTIFRIKFYVKMSKFFTKLRCVRLANYFLNKLIKFYRYSDVDSFIKDIKNICTEEQIHA